MMLGISANAARASFFDRKKVQDALSRAERKALSRFGAFVRRRAQTSIRKRKAISEPGDPPSGHVGTLRKLIFFAYDARSHSVVIGPTQSKPNGEAPRLLEEGGETARVDRKGVARRLVYRARPYMVPAFNAELADAPEHWRNQMRA
jgi:hypothetical protein